MKINDLKTLYPEIAAQWDTSSNNDLQPDQIAAHSNKPYYWLCEKGHSFISSPDKRTRGYNCPYCSNRTVLPGFNDLESTFPNIAAEWDFSKNIGSPKDYTHRSTYKAHWKCSKCGKEWAARIRDRVDSKWKSCPTCTASKRGEVRHQLELKRKGSITHSLLIKEWDYEKNKKGPQEYTPKSNEEVFWICSKCGYHFKAKISNRVRRNGGCACCRGLVHVKGINDLTTTHPKLAAEWHPVKNNGLLPADVSYGMAKKVWWICPEGHEFQASLNHRSHGTNCPVCNSGRQTSFAEQATFYYIKKIFPDAINRYTDIFDNGMELDIYIPSLRFAIEYDGSFWHKTNTVNREIEKYRICQEHGITLLRLKESIHHDGPITADKYLSIDGNMYEHNQLDKVIFFLLSEIDPETNMWTRKHPHRLFSNVDINIERDELEIRSYMTKLSSDSFADKFPNLVAEWHSSKNGALSPNKVKPYSDMVVWWKCPICNNEYKASICHRSYGTGCPKCGIIKSAQKRSKQVAMCDITTKTVIEVFNSISEASRKTKINSSNISMVCKGQRSTAGGYFWTYMNNNQPNGSF